MGCPLFVHRAAARALAPGGILPRQVTEENLGCPLFRRAARPEPKASAAPWRAAASTALPGCSARAPTAA